MYYDRLMNSINLFFMTTLVFMKHTSEDVSLSLSFFLNISGLSILRIVLVLSSYKAFSSFLKCHFIHNVQVNCI